VRLPKEWFASIGSQHTTRYPLAIRIADLDTPPAPALPAASASASASSAVPAPAPAGAGPEGKKAGEWGGGQSDLSCADR
jgi:hypothetical protein